MKRHPALEQLSRDHHHALVAAQRLRRTQESTSHAARAGFLDYWRAEGKHHFREEEETLFPTLAQFADPYQPLVARVLVDHVRIRRLAEDLDYEFSLDTAHTLGAELEQHIRREERDLFPLIEQVVPEHELVRLSSLLEHPGPRPRSGRKSPAD